MLNSYKKNYYIFLCIIYIFLCRCASNSNSIENLPKDFKPYFEFENIQSIYSENMITQIKRKLPKLIRKNNGDEEYPEGIEMKLYNEKGIMTTTLKANRGFYNSKKDIYQVSDNVIIINILQNHKLETPLLNWHSSREEMYTDTIIKITTPTQVLNGIGLTAKKDFSEYEIKEILSEEKDFFDFEENF